MNRQEMINKLRDLADYNEEAGNVSDAQLLREIADNLQIKPDPIQDIVKLNEERYGLEFDGNKAYQKLSEEMHEFEVGLHCNSTTEIIDALNDIIVIAVGEIRKIGYNPECTLNEVVKEISSREQDPMQKQRWISNDKQPGEKWLKNPLQDKSTLYKADFNRCKLEV